MTNTMSPFRALSTAVLLGEQPNWDLYTTLSQDDQELLFLIVCKSEDISAMLGYLRHMKKSDHCRADPFNVVSAWREAEYTLPQNTTEEHFNQLRDYAPNHDNWAFHLREMAIDAAAAYDRVDMLEWQKELKTTSDPSAHLVECVMGVIRQATSHGNKEMVFALVELTKDQGVSIAEYLKIEFPSSFAMYENVLLSKQVHITTPSKPKVM